MLTPFDDYPVHQTAAPIAQPASGDRNHYDRYFFNGYDRDGEVFFAVAMGLYPNRQVIDAAFSVVSDGVQRSVFASGRIPLDRSQTRIGPISVEIVEPLRVNRVTVDAARLGITADVTYRARTIAVEEERQQITSGATPLLDTTRLTQWGTWEGSILTGDRAIALDPRAVLGTKDRSWGVRPVGEPAGGAPTLGMASGGGLFWLWAPVHFDGDCFHLAIFEHPDGQRWYEHALSVPVLAAGQATFGEQKVVRATRGCEYRVEYRSGTRRSRACALDYRFVDGSSSHLDLEPVLDFQMQGIGYLHPRFGHGTWQGESMVAGEEFVLADVDPLAVPNIHVQQLCRVRRIDGDGAEHRGVGVLEQLVIGPHAPSGLRDFLDGAP